MNVMTIDVEDWYHSLDPDPARWDRYQDRVEPPVRLLLDLFEEHDVRATFFVLGHVASRHPGLVREIARRGHEVGSHGSSHRFAYRQSRAEFERDVADSLNLLADLSGSAVISYRAPYFSITRDSLWALEVLTGLGITHDSSIFPVHNPRYGIPGAPAHPHRLEMNLIEVPPSTLRVGSFNLPVAGGVYFRAFPWRVLRGAYRRIEASGRPVVFYLHPWELDPGQPRIPLAAGLRLRHYWRLASTESTLRACVSEFEFGPVREVRAA